MAMCIVVALTIAYTLAREPLDRHGTVNQQILAAIKFGVSQNKVIWRLLNLASRRLCNVRSTYNYVF